APGTDPQTSFALQRDRRYQAIDDFPEQLAELTGYLHATFPETHPLARLAASLPGLPFSPRLWLLGSSPQSAIWAGELGLPYSFADFINPAGAEIAALYRERFVPSAELAEPELAIAVSTIAADTDDEAERLASSARMAFALLRRGRPSAIPPVETALEFLSQIVPSELAMHPRRLVVGTPERVRAGLEAVAEEYGAGEVAAVTIVHDHAARRRSYELIASAFGL
ncbi:MAG TPA: MsnO8 family LLM class oxidoreductase, partial [Gaiellales bacterium]